ncbi:MAG: hypothetical protein ABEH65_03035 [Halobacteriales archaeon]
MAGRVLIAIVLLVMLAGCQGLVDETLEPLDRASIEPSTGATVTAPGVTRDGVVNPGALAAAHVSSLADQSYTVRANLTVLAPNGSIQGQRVAVMRVDPDGGQFSLRQTARGSFPWPAPPASDVNVPLEPKRAVPLETDLRGFSDGNWTYLRRPTPNGTLYQRDRPRFAVVQTDSFVADGAIHARFRGIPLNRTTITEAQRDGWPVYRITATTSDDRHVTALVDPLGLVYTLRADWPTADGTSEGRVIERFRFSAIGNTTVDRPPWVDHAIDNTTATVDG